MFLLIGTVSHVRDVAHGPLVYAWIVFYMLYMFVLKYEICIGPRESLSYHSTI